MKENPSCGSQNFLASHLFTEILTATPFLARCIVHRTRSQAKPEGGTLPNCATPRIYVIFENLTTCIFKTFKNKIKTAPIDSEPYWLRN